MTAWMYMPNLPIAGNSIAVDAGEARHAAMVRRLGKGDQVQLFDGRGTVADAVITHAERHGRELEVEVQAIMTQDLPRPHVQLATALPKGDRQGVLLSMATQLGVSVVTPLLCERSVAKPGKGFTARAERICIESCKQSKRAYLPRVTDACSIPEMVNKSQRTDTTLLIAHPGGSAIATSIPGDSRPMVLMIGPEGGFTDEEVGQVIEAGGRCVALGNSILRVETAAVAFLSVVMLAGLTERNESEQT